MKSATAGAAIDELYDMPSQAALVHERIPGGADIVYLPVYPPQVSIFFAPLARLSYDWAIFIWLTVSTVIYVYCCYAVWRVCPNLRDEKFTIFILAAAYPAFFHLILWGQTSALALASFTLAYFALRAENHLLAGIAFGALAFKPQLGLVAAIVFLAMRNWTLIAGAILSAAAQFHRGPLDAVPGDGRAAGDHLHVRGFGQRVVDHHPQSRAEHAAELGQRVLVLRE